MSCFDLNVFILGTADYHKEMNSQHFENWWIHSVLPNVCNKSVIIIDNASYHSRQTDESRNPTTSWRKANIQNWLKKHNIDYLEKDTIPILLCKAKQKPLQKEYVLESITKRYCQTEKKDVRILRLPVGHSELNPIELIWAQIKSEVARNNTKFNLTAVKILVNSAIKNVTADNWKKCIKHCREVEKEFRDYDFGKKDPKVPPVIINIESESSDSDSDSSCYDSD